MKYKLRYDISGRKRPVDSSESKWKAPVLGEDIVCSAPKDAAVYNGMEVTTPSEQ